MKLTITIDLETATFENDEQETEALAYPLALIGEALDDIKGRLSYDGNDDYAFDRHANQVGTWELDPGDWTNTAPYRAKFAHG
jgi:hypothetical protein